MFFDEDFEPSNYVDALFSSVIKNNSTSTNSHSGSTLETSSPLALSSQVYNEKTLHALQNKCSNLVSHLDYYTNELFTQLSEKLESLKDSASIVSSGIAYLESNDDNSMTRLQYYIKSMGNAVSSLQQEVQATIDKPKPTPEVKSQSSLTLLSSLSLPKGAADEDPITKLSQLREVKLKLEGVLDIFERIWKEIQPESVKDSDSYAVVTIEQFTDRMISIHKKLTSEAVSAESGSTSELTKDDIIKYTDNLSSVLPLFQGTSFHPIFKEYITKILVEEEKHLGRKI